MKRLLIIGVLTTLAGCSNWGYYSHSVRGHWSLLVSSRPVTDWLADAQTPEPLRQSLQLAQQLRVFSIEQLHLPDNASYRRYADLHRNASVWNVVATPELSLRLQTWCFLVVGCVGYRGYFDEAQAQAFAQTLRKNGLEVSVYPVPAYSTLGKLPGVFFSDPLLNTFIHYPAPDLAGMMFHELAHQVAYAPGDTGFNESFATAVERLGVARWLAQQDDPQHREYLARAQLRRQAFRSLTLKARAELAAVYQSAMLDAEKRAAKAAIMAALRAQYAELKATAPWADFSGYDAWFERANNASLSVLAAYDDGVAPFEALFEKSGQDFSRFYDEVKRLAALPQAQRQWALEAYR